MTILKNAIDSISIGLEDYASSDQRRILSSTRNIFAGILLLFKHKLCELSPPDSDEVLIKQKVLPEFDDHGNVNWIGVGNKTVDVQNIKERFQSLKIEVDWKRIESINKYRNDIEHYYSQMTSESVQTLISDSFIIIRDFITEVLNEDPIGLLGEDSWGILVKINEVYEKEKATCATELEKLDYLSDSIRLSIFSYKCENCGSGLISPLSLGGSAIRVDFECRSCQLVYPYHELVIPALNIFFRNQLYSAAKWEAETPIIICPYCNEDSYIYHEKMCALCEYSAEHDCERCGAKIPPEEITEDSYCGWCVHMMDKINNE